MKPHDRHRGCIDPTRRDRLLFALWTRSRIVRAMRGWWRDLGRPMTPDCCAFHRTRAARRIGGGGF